MPMEETPSQGDAAMNTTHGTTRLERTSVSTRHVFSFIWKYWDAFQERRERQKLRATLSDLSDRELMDIGTTCGEIDYIASHRGIDPRGMRSGEWLRYLPRWTAKLYASRHTNTRKPTSGRGQFRT
jgi:uncharacterized protein YjiS (DUF1127 family)